MAKWSAWSALNSETQEMPGSDPSDVNKSLDGCTYPGQKLTSIAEQNYFLASAIGNRLSSGTSGATYCWWSFIVLIPWCQGT